MYYNPKDSGMRIANLRKKKGLTQEQLAEKLNISTSNLGKLERGLQGISKKLKSVYKGNGTILCGHKPQAAARGLQSDITALPPDFCKSDGKKTLCKSLLFRFKRIVLLFYPGLTEKPGFFDEIL